MRLVMRCAAMIAVVVMALGLATGGDKERTLKGTYQWTDGGKSGDVKAVFTPSGEARWNVAFHFEFDGSPHTYSGTAEGTLAGGELKGSVQNEKKNRSWTFNGTFTEGEFRCTHTETTGGEPHPSGTLTLKG